MRKKLLAFFFCMFFFPVITHANSLAANEIARQLGWVETGENRCGGYYREAPFDTSLLSTKDAISMTSEQGLFSLHGTSMTQGKVTITRLGQQITASKAYIYRDPVTGKLSSIDLIDHVVLREPNELIVAEKGHYEIKTKRRSLQGILFRSAISNSAPVVNFKTLDLDKERHVTQLSAWGRAKNFIQNEPKIYLFDDVSYTTCPPLASVWNVLADKITLNKITGRGTARNARVYVKDIPVFYSPYLNFPIDDRRQTGFLTPTVGSDSQLGYSIGTPFYWNLAPNYDTTITPLFTSLRTLQLSDTTRYLTHKSKGEVYLSVVPHDKTFSNFQSSEFDLNKNSMNPIVQAELNHLQNASCGGCLAKWVMPFMEHKLIREAMWMISSVL
ncbi:hypothetical protein AYO45_06920 [Gammaproteobacteria bacterium SCGC AG-212-F23]|nr:hypothetical protein AYO45_06920 [Gammaproteobacteria bacterium SCGC AG-212-F23]